MTVYFPAINSVYRNNHACFWPDLKYTSTTRINCTGTSVLVKLNGWVSNFN